MSDHDQRRHDDKPVAQTPRLDPDGRARSLRSTLIIRGFWIVVILILIQIDGSLNEPLQKFYDMLGGDIRREIKAYSQFGGFTSVVLIGLVMILMDRPKVSRVWDLALAMGLSSLTTMALKILIGRPRPKFDVPGHFLGFWDTMTTTRDAEPIHSWEIWANAPNQLWSMPSGHTSAGFALAAFVGITYPKLRWLAFAIAVVVPISRMTEDAHWTSDVVAGACVGTWVAGAVTRHGLGRRLAGRLGLSGRGRAHEAASG